MTSRQFLTWLETQLVAQGVQKVVPDAATLAVVYQQMIQAARLQRVLEATFATLPAADTIAVPDTLADAIRDALTDDPVMAWDAALWEIVCAAPQEE